VSRGCRLAHLPPLFPKLNTRLRQNCLNLSDRTDPVTTMVAEKMILSRSQAGQRKLHCLQETA
jgi:hypothetical protein